MYKLNQYGGYIRLTDGASIPQDAANTDYKAVLAWIASGNAPEPADVPAPAPVVTTPLQFIERFTESEQLAIVTAAMSTPALRLWYDKLMAAQEVVFDDPRLSGGLDALVSAGLITAERKVELLTP